MIGESTVEITITIVDNDLDEEELEEETRKLYRRLREVDELETVDRVPAPKGPDGSKGGSHLPGILKAEAKSSDVEDVKEYVQTRLSEKVEIKIKAKGKEVPTQ